MQRAVIILAYFFVCTNTIAQQYPFVYYTPKDGLINSRVKRIKQGSSGFIYFITHGGLSVYDGARFANYSQENGLANELVNDIIELAPDSILVATNIDKLNTLVNGKAGVFQTSDNFYPVINSFFKSTNGNIYVAADQGLFLFSKRRFIKIPLHLEGGSEIGNDLAQICEWKNFLFLTKWNSDNKERLIVYDTIARKVIDVETNEVVSLPAVDKQGEIWVGTKAGIRQLDTASLKKGRIIFSSNFPKNHSLANLKGATAFFDNLNSKFFFNKDGAFRINSRGEYQPFTVTQGLKTTNLSDVFIDREANIWIATDGNGVAKLTNSGFEIWEKLNNTSAVISAITCEADTIWAFNTTDHSIYKIYGNSFSIYPLPGSISGVNGIYIKNEKLYLVLLSSILCVKNKNTRSSYNHPEMIFSDENVLLGSGLLDPYGNIIIEVNRNNKQFYSFVIGNMGVLFQNQHETISDQITLDSLGRLWFISRNNQLLMYSLHPDDPAHYLQLQKDFSKYFSNLAPRSIVFDRNNNLWIGTRYNGLYVLRLRSEEPDSIIHLSRKDGLSDNFIYSLASDTKGNVWAGTQTGLDKIFEKNGHYVIGNISKSNNQYRAIHMIVITKNNTTWALTYGIPILKISDEGAAPISEPPRLTFRQMKINDSVFRFNKNAFNYNQNNFSFSVAAPSFIDEKSIHYSYLLEGSGNNTWSEASNQSVFNFINLSPAHYTLKVKCKFPEEIYASQTISYSFIIDPPWWQTWWFRSIMVLLIIGLLILAFRFYYRRKLEKQMAVLEKQQAIEKERTRIATDMHDDLGAGLSRIKFLSETIGIKKQKDFPIEEDINKIRDYSHEMIDKMGEIVWALNEKNDSLSDLLSYTRSYAVEYLSQNGIHCSIEAPEQFPTSFVTGEFRRNIYLIVKEALHNIVKHAQANHVSIKITTEKQLEVYIGDDGIGFDKKNIRPFSNGLSNMEKRIKEIGGNLSISTGNGTTVHLTAPLMG